MKRTALLVAVPALALGGCGVSIKNADHEHFATQPAARPAAVKSRPARRPIRHVKLPARPAGVVAVDGRTDGSLTSAIAPRVSGTRVTIADRGEHAGFEELCRGEVDAVDSTRPMSRAEYAACRRTGVQPVQFQIAADAVVVATKNEADVGVDCLTQGQVQEIFRAGSPLTNWSQVHGYDVPMTVTGPEQNGNGFDFFTRYALGSDPPTLLAYRTDYHPRASDRDARVAVVGNRGLSARERLLRKARRDLASLRRAIVVKRRAVSAARHQVVKGRHDKRPPVQQAADRANLAAQQRGLRKLERSLPPAERFLRTSNAAVAGLRNRRGVVGYFRFSYYELFEEQLRPIEIDADPADKTPNAHNCIFPSQDTVTSATFPLARQLLITVSKDGLRRAEVQAFLHAYLSNAQQLATSRQLVPLPDGRIQTEQSWLSGARQPPVVYYPPPKRRRRT